MKLIILPIELSDSNKIKAVYCTEEKSTVEIQMDHAVDSAQFSTIRRMYSELGVEDLDHSQIFKLGSIDGALCYAVNITNTPHSHSLTRVAFHKIMEGEYTDSKLLAACFLTISYFS